MSKPVVSIIIPMYNEHEIIGSFLTLLFEAFDKLNDVSTRYILVNDGSTDGTVDAVKAHEGRAQHDVTLVTLMRNKGHQAALYTGLSFADGDLVLMMDSDGQHPVEVAVNMVVDHLADTGRDITQAVRHGSQGKIKDVTAGAFYRAINKMVPETHLESGASDFRVINQATCKLMLSDPSCRRNIRVFLGQFNLVSKRVPFSCSKRLGGRSKYTMRKMLQLGVDGLFSFTYLPLRINMLIAAALMVLGSAYFVFMLIMKSVGTTVPGWSSLIGLLCLLFSGVFAMLAVLSEYVITMHRGDAERSRLMASNFDKIHDAELKIETLN